ncbi:MAG: hypothetical protein JRH20_07075 [Deltaproteobacteria bacterium]|nr:hypothetical protein [Deltaproteobacteria bacterium]
MGLSRLGLLALMTVGLFANGCVVEDNGGPGDIFVADLEVEWSIEGGLSSSLCDSYEVDHWVITATGPEQRQHVADCYDDAWDTGTSFYAMEEGRYSINLAVYDFDGYDVGGVSRSLDLEDRGVVEVVTLVLYPSDLGF